MYDIASPNLQDSKHAIEILFRILIFVMNKFKTNLNEKFWDRKREAKNTGNTAHRLRESSSVNRLPLSRPAFLFADWSWKFLSPRAIAYFTRFLSFLSESYSQLI